MLLLILLCMTAHGAIHNRVPKSTTPNDGNNLEIIITKQDHPQESTLRFEKDRAAILKKAHDNHLKTLTAKRDHNQEKTLQDDNVLKPQKTTDIKNHLELTVSKRDRLQDMTVRDDIESFNEVKHLSLDSSVHKVDVNDNDKPQTIELIMNVGFDPQASEQIGRLTRVLEDLNESITAQTNEAKFIPIDHETTVKSNRRRKRNVDNGTHMDIVTNVTDTEETVDNQNKTIDNGNSTTECNGTSGCRRSFTSDLQVSSAIKMRLLSYIHEYFYDIAKKINSLKNVKNTFASDDEYNIGYMIANIDMLEVNLRNLKAEMEANKHNMGEKQILDMFDKVKVSNGVVSSLLSALKSIVDRHTEHQQGVNQYQLNE